MRSKVQGIVEKYHTDKAVASRVLNFFIYNIFIYFEQNLNIRQKQTTLDSCFSDMNPMNLKLIVPSKDQKRKRPQI